MFGTTRKRTKFSEAMSILGLIYHSTVRSVRQAHSNALIGLLSNMMQTITFVAAFYFMFTVLGLRGMAIRGDFLLYIMSGIFLFLTHTKTMAAVLGSEGPASAMMKHAPMNTLIAITSSALGALYIQVLSLFFILFIYNVVITPVEIDNPYGAFGMLLTAWFSGIAVGMVFLALKPWSHGFVTLLSSVYARANMIASGKMFVANQLPSFMLAMFDWNPLFHSIDQARGFAFINYNPRYSTWDYPIYVSLALIMVGLMGEFYTRKHASESWNARG